MIGYDWLVQDFAIHLSKNSQICVINPFWKTGVAWAKKHQHEPWFGRAFKGSPSGAETTTKCHENHFTSKKLELQKAFSYQNYPKPMVTNLILEFFLFEQLSTSPRIFQLVVGVVFLKATSNSLPCCLGAPNRITHTRQEVFCAHNVKAFHLNPIRRHTTQHNLQQKASASKKKDPKEKWGSITFIIEKLK